MKFLKFLQGIPFSVYLAILIPTYPLVATLIEGEDFTFYVITLLFCTIVTLPMIVAELRDSTYMSRGLIGLILFIVAIFYKSLPWYVTVALWVLTLIISIKSKKEQA